MNKQDFNKKRRNKIILISEEILEYLLEYKELNNDFVFHLRQREAPKALEPRLANGFWFQGSDYIWVSPYNQGDDHNKTRSIGFVVEFDRYHQPRFSKQMAFGGNDNWRFIEFYEELARIWFKNDLNPNRKKYKKSYPDKNLIQALDEFLTVDKPIIDQLIVKYGYGDSFFLRQKEFQRQLQKTLKKRQELKGLQEILVPDSELEGEEGEIKLELKWHKKRERDRDFVKRYKSKYKHIERCPACLIDIFKIYKLKAIDVLELHHTLPLSKMSTGVNQKLNENDVILLCPNCHRVIHRLMSKNNLAKITLEDFQSYLT